MRLLLVFALLCASMLRANDLPCGALYVIPPYSEAFGPLVLTLPNTSPFNQVGGPRLVVEKLGATQPIKWQGLACDEVRLPIGSKIGVRVPDSEEWADYKQIIERWEFELLPDGFLWARLR